jgi:hypothetical protein
MTQYHAFQEHLTRLSVPNFPMKHWSADSGWEIAKALAHVVSETTKTALKQASFISVSADEVTTIDHESWLSVHAYIIRKGKWSWESLLVMLVRMMEANNAQVVKEAILTVLIWYGGMTQHDIAEKVVCFGANGVSRFVTWTIEDGRSDDGRWIVRDLDAL